jgi:hypothetical protein
LFDVPTSFNDQGRIARITSERGAVLPLMALMLVVLMGSAAMAIDLGWLFLAEHRDPTWSRRRRARRRDLRA